MRGRYLLASASTRALGDGVGGLVMHLGGVRTVSRATTLTGARIWRAVPDSYDGPAPVPLAVALSRVEADERKAEASRRSQAAASRPPVPPELMGAPAGEGHSDTAVVVLWDLDNKQPYRSQVHPRYLAAALRAVGGRLGSVVDMQAFANRHAFTWTSPFQADIDEANRDEEALHAGCICPLCGRRCGDPVTLRKHFAKLHEREAAKRVAHAKKRGALGKAADREFRFREARRAVVRPASGNATSWSLRREGVQVQVVPNTPQAADTALIATLRKLVAGGGGAEHSKLHVLLVSDDSDFLEPLRQAAKASNVRATLVSCTPPAPNAPPLEWVSWQDVCALADRIQAAGPPALDAAWGVAAKIARTAGDKEAVDTVSWSQVSLSSTEPEAGSPLLGTVTDPNAPWQDASHVDTAAQLSDAMSGILGDRDALSDDADDFGAEGQGMQGTDDEELSSEAAWVADAAARGAVELAIEEAQLRRGAMTHRQQGAGRSFSTRSRQVQ